MDPALRLISGEDTRALRHQVLRPNQPGEAAAYPLDDQADAAHVGAFVGEYLVGVASVYREAEDGATDTGQFRVRGMAVAPDRRGLGLGRRLLAACVDHARARGGTRVWCNARITAAEFYARCGFHQVGEDFDLPPLGPHRVMALDLASTGQPTSAA